MRYGANSKFNQIRSNKEKLFLAAESLKPTNIRLLFSSFVVSAKVPPPIRNQWFENNTNFDRNLLRTIPSSVRTQNAFSSSFLVVSAFEDWNFLHSSWTPFPRTLTTSQWPDCSTKTKTLNFHLWTNPCRFPRPTDQPTNDDDGSIENSVRLRYPQHIINNHNHFELVRAGPGQARPGQLRKGYFPKVLPTHPPPTAAALTISRSAYNGRLWREANF